MQSLAEDYPQIDVRCYEAGIDTDYIPKYGMVMRSVLIVNESILVTELSKSIIRKVFRQLSATGTVSL